MTQSTVVRAVVALLVLVAIVTQQQSHHVVVGVYGFSMSMSMSSIMTSDSNNNFDRFKSVCLTDKKKRESVIKEFGDESLLSSLGLHSKNVDDDNENDNDNENDELWAAVYRSNNNKPSVIVRDDFFRAMNDATTKSSTTTKSSADDNDDAMNNVSTISPSNTATFLSDTMPDLLQIPSSKPVAIARLIKTNNNDSYLLDNLRCSLKKEDQDINCDGGSEYLEALACAVDTLLLNHLQKLLLSSSSSSTSTNISQENDVPIIFKDGSIRTKATLFNSKLFEQRGFIPIETLSRDMATHVSNYNSCSNSYTERASSGEQSTTTTTATNSGIGFGQKQKQSDDDDDAASSSNNNNDNTTTTTTMMATGTRDRALQIVSLLGRLDPKNIASDERNTNKTDDDDKDDEEDEYDPWATMYVKR